MMLVRDFRPGDLVWFDPGVGYVLPGEVVEFHKAAQVITVQAVINNVTKTFTLNNLSSVKTRQDLGANGVEDMITLSDLNEASLLWNLRIRYDNQNIYSYIGSILVAVNPYRMFDIYGLDTVSRYEGRILGTLPPHLFAMGATAYNRLLAKDGQNQVMVISGESGAGKTESTKLLMQYLAAVNKSSSNLITEQILEASPLLESFGNAKTLRNDNSSRFGKYLEVKFNRGIITGAKVTQYLLEKSRIVTHAPDERNYHIFYEMLSGMPKEQKDSFGLMSAEKYFYLNQGGSCNIDGKTDRDDFESLLSAMQVLGFSGEERDTIFKILASVLHLGNVYFHRKQLKHGQEGVEIGSDAEIKWAAHLLQLNVVGMKKSMTTRTVMSESRNNKNSESVLMHLNIDQALDARDAIAKSLYSTLFTWLVTRVNKIIGGGSTGPSKKAQQQQNKNIISILDIFGFEDFVENSFEQLCINFANESLQYFFNKHVFKLEQAEYAKEKIEWTPIGFTDNQSILHMLAKKPVGIFHLLDDESNFPKASDLSFLEKCHYNHALNELYSRPRMSSMEFGIKHYAGQVWYNVEGFLDKNRDTLRYDVMGLLIGSKDKLISKMFLDLRNFHEAGKTHNKPNGQFITVKPRTPTVAARFHDSLNQLLATMSDCHPWFIRCLKPNSDKCPMKFDMPVVLEQLRYTGMLETVRIRKTGYAVRLKYQQFANRYRCLLKGRIPRGAPTKEISRVILDNYSTSYERDSYALGASKVFLRENLESVLEKTRQDIQEIEVLKLQRFVRGYLARKRFTRMKRSAIKIQSAYRGYTVRKEYSTVRKGVVALQAIYRMKKQQSIYGEMKTELQRRQEVEREARERARQLRANSQEKTKEHVEEKSGIQSGRSRAVASVNHLEIPAELAFVLSKLDNWEPVNTEKSLAKVSGQVPAALKTNFKLPHDIDYYVFSKWTNIYFKSHLWQMKREPIKTPFLSKSKESDYHESLAIFKLILRFMNDASLSGRKEKVLGDYIINKGIQNEKLRDEIYCQLANQTWKNDNEENCERGWFLMSNCLSAFPPSRTLYKYLLKYVSDHGYDGYKALCQQKLLKAGKFDSHTTRQFPPTVLEWRANKKRVNLALEAKSSDGDARHGAVDSFTTSEEFAANILQDRGIVELQGWTIAVEEGGDTCAELNGGDFVLDGIGELELPPAFPANKGQFLVTTDRSRGRLPLFVDTEMLLNGPQNGSSNSASGGRFYRHSASPPDRIGGGHILNRQQRAQSQDRILVGGKSSGNNDFGLSGKSALNDRYFEEKGVRSKSLDNLIEPTKSFGLSESKLNQRYLSHTVNEGEQAEADTDLGRLERWDNIGLSKTPLNDRYFSQPDLGGAVGGTSYEDRARSSGNLKAPAGKNDAMDMSQFDYPEEQQGIRRHGHPRFVKGGGRRRNDRSSAMSDTSEAPSVASHVRRVRVPSQASDVDQFLDDLFMPVLDGNMDADGLSDARSLAASMRGGGDRTNNPEDLEVQGVFSASKLVKRQTGAIPKTQDTGSVTSMESNMSGLCLTEALLSAVKGGGEDSDASPQRKNTTSDFTQTPNIGFQPIPGLISPTPMMGGMMSPPPMLMPTPIPGGQLSMLGPGGYPSLTSPMMLGQGMNATTASEITPAMAFTYVPVPVYNMTGMGMGMNPHMGVMSPNTTMPAGNQTVNQPQPQGTSTPLAAGVPGNANDSMHNMSAAQMSYQQAFLQNAVAQNMQIQQQLMMQNQALSQLLSQSGNAPGGSGNNSWTSGGPNSSMTTMMGTPMASVMPGQMNMNMNMAMNMAAQQTAAAQAKPTQPQESNQAFFGSDALRRASIDHLDEVKTDKDLVEMKQRSMSTPNTPKQTGLQVPPQAPMMSQDDFDSSHLGHLMDPYTRARTVRIGKWRWPPPKEEMVEGAAPTAEQQAEGFFEFKMRKLHQKMNQSKDSNNQGKEDSFDTSGIDWEEDDDFDDQNERKRKHKKANKDPFDDEDDMETEKSRLESNSDGKNGSVGKLKLSNEMKEKLEAVTGSRKNSVRSNASSSKRSELEITPDTVEVRKLSENRKLLMEQKLGGAKLKKWNTVDEVHRTVEIPEAPNRKSGGSVNAPLPPPPPPPPLPGGLKPPLIHLMKPLHVVTGNEGPPSPDSVSFYSPDGSLPDPRGQPPAPIKPVPGLGPANGTGFRRSVERRGSDSTHQTEKTEKYELEESSEFLEPVDGFQVDENDYAALEEIKTKVHPPASNTHFAYNRVPWTLKIRKEVFSPSETLNSPLAINLVFCQIVTDVFSPLCIRFSGEDRSRMKTLLDEYEINLKNVFGKEHKLSTKKNIIDMAKELPTYFARLYPVSSSQSGDVQYLAVSHSGVRLVRREKSLPTDYLHVLDTFYYEDIGEVSTIKKSGLQLVMHTGGRVVLSTPKAGQIKDLLNQYIIEASSGQYDYVKALAEFSSRDESALNFKKGDIIAVVPKHDAYTEKGWLYGIKDGNYGLFPSDFVERMSPQAIRREMRIIAKVTRSSFRHDDDMEDEVEEVGVRKQLNGARGTISPLTDNDFDGHGDPSWESGKGRLQGLTEDNLSEVSASAANLSHDGKHSLLEFAMRYFRGGGGELPPEMLEGASESLKKSKLKKKKSSGKDWTWKDQVDMVKWTDRMINNSLLRLEPADLNKMALECFACIMRYMGDLGLLKNQTEVDCVNTILMYCHKFEPIRDEVFCQIMKQTTNNKSSTQDSCQKGWRLFSIVAAYFTCSPLLKPYLFKYLESSAYDKRRAYHGTALVCLHNLRKTFKFGGRKNVPSIEEITAISAGRNSKRQIYRLPGGTERVINTKSTTVVTDIIEELCNVIGVNSVNEREEFSLYCIVEGETFTVPLAKDHYILDVTTELQRDGAIYYLIFCRSVWHYPLRLDNPLYIEVVFNQIAPDYLEGLLLVMPGEQIDQEVVYDIAKVAALLHRAADMDHKPTIKETKFLLPKPALSARDIKPPQWVNMVQGSWQDIHELTTSQAKAQVLEILSNWPLFGSSFFAVRRVDAELKEPGASEHILALNRTGVSFLDLITHETLIQYPFTEVISTRKVQTEDGTLFLDMKCGNLMQQRITRIQTEQANEIARLIRQYITIDQKSREANGNEQPESSDHGDEKNNSPSR